MRYTTAGESHGQAVIAIVSDVPAGFAVSEAVVNADLARRQSGYGRGGRQAIEHDTVRVLSGLRFGRTIGSPLAMEVANLDWANWSERMATSGRPPADLVRETAPRPGHADLPGAQKTGASDCRDILERASARETAARVAAGAIAKAWLANFGVEVHSYVTRIGSVELPKAEIARKAAVFSAAKIEGSELRCPCAETTEAMKQEVDAARAAGESLGGWFNVVASGLVPGIGGYAEAAQRLDGRIAGALMSIPAIKGVQIGLGFEAATLPGSKVHDPIVMGSDAAGRIQPVRATNNAGGVEGGMTNGETLVASCAMKPIPTLARPLATVDLISGERREASKERSDVVAVPAAAVVGEAELAMVLANAYCEKFGGDALADSLSAFEHYVARLRAGR